MKNIFLLCLGLLLTVGVLTGCKTTNPATGESEFDQVKTEQVKAILKPQVATAVTLIVAENPDTREHFQLAADAICKLRDEGKVSPASFQEALNAAFATHPGRVDPALVAGINAIVLLVDLQFAQSARADLPEDEYAWNIFDTICEGINQGLAPSAPPE